MQTDFDQQNGASGTDSCHSMEDFIIAELPMIIPMRKDDPK